MRKQEAPRSMSERLRELREAAAKARVTAHKAVEAHADAADYDGRPAADQPDLFGGGE